MEKIAVYNISRLQKIFEMTGAIREFLLIDQQHYTPSTEEPFRTDSYAIAFLKQGSLRVTTGLQSVLAEGPALLTIGPSIIRTIERSGDDPVLDLLFFKGSFFLESQANSLSLLEFTFFEDEGSHLLHLSMPEAEKITRLFDMLKETLSKGHPHESALVRSYIHILLCEMDAAYGYHRDTRRGTAGRTPPLLANFRSLLSREALRQRSVRYYAESLHVTPKYLSEFVKAQTGRTAGEWIDQMVVLEAKVLLQNAALTIAQISDQLNFSDQSVFGKFFKVNTGLSPLHYRNSLT